MTPAAPTGSKELEKLLSQIDSGEAQQLYLVSGEAVLAEQASSRLAEALAARAGVQVVTHRRPADFGEILADLKTLALFDSAKVTLVIESALLADRAQAADLVDEAAEALPVEPGEELTEAGRVAASRLLQTLRLFGIEAFGDPDDVLGSLPSWAFEGGASFRKGRRSRGRGKKQATTLREGLAVLLHQAQIDGVSGYSEDDVAQLSEVAREGLPAGHSLVLAESRVAKDHPLAVQLREQGALLQLAKVTVDRRGGFDGVESVAAGLASETGVQLRRDGLEELIRRTLKKESRGVDAESTTRFAAEYRKIAHVASGRGLDAVGADVVREVVDDRGDEDVWKILDSISEQRPQQLHARLHRLLLAASDPMATRLSFFSLLADYCRHLVSIDARLKETGLPRGERNYNRFKDRIAPRLQEPRSGGTKTPISSLHPYRLHRAYLAVSQMTKTSLEGLPGAVLEAEMRLKGESSDPDTALLHLAARLASARVIGSPLRAS